MDDSAPAIELSGVSKRFGAVTALDGVSCSVRAGEMFFLLGPSGCGKTTLLRILAGLETPDAGTIRFFGQDILALPPHKRGAPMVFQSYALWPHLSVKDNVAFGLVERRVPGDELERRVAEVLATVELNGLEARMPGQLSGGQQQRVVLARALVLNPTIILLDEPLSNLDAKLRIEMREEIARLHARTNITFVYVTHDQAEALALADRMIVMNAGRISGLGVPADLYHRPPNAFCAEFLGETNRVTGTVTAVNKGTVTVKTLLGEWTATVCGVTAPALGSEVQCMVRPENLVPAPAPAGNRFEARVGEVRMSGATVTVHLDAAGQTLKATLLNRSAREIKPGETMPWSVAVEDTVLLA